MTSMDAARPASWLRPHFTSPRVGALMTSRHGGVSPAPFDSFNLRLGLGDDDTAVAVNRARLLVRLGRPSVLLQQVHGTTCLTLTDAGDASLAAMPVADASLSVVPGIACEIQVADCLPVLMADRRGRGVAAAHAGWRGLAGGVVQATLAALCRASGARPRDIEVWLGACIGPRQFEVGADVFDAFGAAPGACFVPRAPLPDLASGLGPKWLADLPALARWTLAGAGVDHITGNDGSPAWCTVENSDFFSYRRDRGRTGRMAACIWLKD
jgi:YfiH family protein